MKTVDELLLELRSLNVKLWTEGHSLRYSNKEILSPTLLTQLRSQEAEILAALNPSFSYLVRPSEGSTSYSSYCALSHGQQALWFLYQMAPESVAYNIFETVRIKSNLNIEAWQRAWQNISDRYAILRTTYTIRNGQPVQQIHQQKKVDLEVIDASAWSQEDLKAQIYQETDRPFKLQSGPVLRVRLFTNTAQGNVQLVVMHQIAGDMWSLDLLLQELQVFYAAEINNEAIFSDSLHSLSCQYTDYVSRQSKKLLETDPEKLWQYWQKQLEGELPILNLPTDKPRPPVQSYQGNTAIFKLDTELIAQLKQLQKSERISLYIIMQAAFFVLLYRYTGQEEILLGTAMTGRSASREFHQIIGYLSNIAVLRGCLAPQLTFRKLLSQVNEIVLGALKHQDAPFSLLVEKLKIQRDRSRFPVVSACFSWYKHRLPSTPELEMEILPELGSQRGSIFDINCKLTQVNHEFYLVWEYSSDLFSEEAIAKMQRHYQTLLEGIISNPDQTLGELPLLTTAERHQLLVEWNNTTTEYPQKSIHQLFAEQVELTPNAVALVFAEQKLTYQELNQKANQLAHYLQSLGVGKEVLVGICVERSLEMIIGLLGILKAGGVYVPIDPNFPQEHIEYVLAETQLSVLLTQTRLRESLSINPIHTICLDQHRNLIAEHSQENPSVTVTSANLAYLMYTFTGEEPKGVSIIHRGVVRLVKNNNYAKFSPEDVFLQLAPITFDAATLEIWGSLLNGASLIILPPDKSELADLGTAIREHQVTTLWLSAGLFGSMVDEQIADLKQLKQLLTGGDVLSVFHVKKLLQAAPELKLINAYGPTENTTFTCCYHITETSPIDTDVPIGRPIANTQIYVLDRELQPLPVGVPGELYIGGDGLAQGYFHQPDLTATAFITNPFHPETRLYKTGDLARYLPDGNIEFMGKIDQQVKIGSLRIELEEIETVLSQHPKVQQAVVTVNQNESDNPYLVAYIVPNSQPRKPTNSSLKSTALRRFLQQQLPEYMVPTTYVILKHIPLTGEGKLNRQALPKPHLYLVESENKFIPPRTPTEAVIADIITTVLNLEEIGIHDNFFALGGNSLLAIQVIYRLRQAYQLDLPLRCLFAAPTVAELENFITSYRQTELGEIVPTIDPASQHQTEFPLSFAQARLWLLDQMVGKSATYNMSFAARIVGNLDINALECSLGEILQRHASLRTNFQVVKGLSVQVINPTATLTLPVINLQCSPEPESEMYRLAKIEAHIPFNLASDSLIRVKLLQLAPEEYVLLLSTHTIVCDRWSIRILLQELSILYPAFCAGQPSPLPDLPIQYVDYTLWQWKSLSTKVLQKQINYWNRQLSGVKAVLELPTDRPRKPLQKIKGSSLKIEIDHQLSRQLKTLSQQSGVTLSTTLLTVLAVLLFRYSEQEDILIGTPIANRHQDTESIIGFFGNLLVLRIHIQENPTFSELLTHVQQVTLTAYAHQDVPFEQIVKTLQPESSRNQNPLVQVMFKLESSSFVWEIPGLSVTPLEIEKMTAKLDLSLLMSETASGLKGIWEYNSDLFDSETIIRMSEHFQTFLAAIVSNPHQEIRQVPLLLVRN
ncbi:amino acid adenylation domain-containing protein [Calothrix membranacea FACHB-236]|nr:amino acid adenylation domain-containing protein [Calothrix membranacea FACHB-236]